VGFTGQDVVGFTGTQFSFPTQMFGQAERIDDNRLQHTPIDGMCGLAFQSISSLKTPNPWMNIISAAGFKGATKTFTVWLQELTGQPMNKTGGAITLGGPDTTHCAATGDWVPLSQDTFYEIKIDGVGSGGTFGNAATAISDFGSGMIVGPEMEVAAIAKALNATHDQQGLHQIDCDPTKTTGTIDVKINGKVYSIRSKNFIIGPFGQDNRCYVSMFGANMHNLGWVLGDPFVREYCTTFDMVGKRVGLFKSTM